MKTARNSPPVLRQNRASARGLTLIELLSAFAILAIIVALLGITLNTATDTWHSAQARTRTVAQARAVMDTLAQDLRQAVATTNFPVTITNAPSSYGATNNAIQFLRICSVAASNQYFVEAVRYGVISSNGTFRLARWTQSLAVDPSGRLPGTMDDDNLAFDTQAPLTLADGLAALLFSPPPVDTNSVAPAGGMAWPYLDVYLELLGAEDSRTAANMSGTTNLTLFVERHVLRFTQRIYLPAVNKWNLP